MSTAVAIKPVKEGKASLRSIWKAHSTTVFCSVYVRCSTVGKAFTMDQVHLDPQDKLPPHPPPLGHIVKKPPSTRRTKKCLRPTHPLRIISGTALRGSTHQPVGKAFQLSKPLSAISVARRTLTWPTLIKARGCCDPQRPASECSSARSFFLRKYSSPLTLPKESITPKLGPLLSYRRRTNESYAPSAQLADCEYRAIRQGVKPDSAFGHSCVCSAPPPLIRYTRKCCSQWNTNS